MYIIIPYKMYTGKRHKILGMYKKKSGNLWKLKFIYHLHTYQNKKKSQKFITTPNFSSLDSFSNIMYVYAKTNIIYVNLYRTYMVLFLTLNIFVFSSQLNIRIRCSTCYRRVYIMLEVKNYTQSFYNHIYQIRHKNNKTYFWCLNKSKCFFSSFLASYPQKTWF